MSVGVTQPTRDLSSEKTTKGGTESDLPAAHRVGSLPLSRTTISSKALVGMTGAALVVFVIGHMLGNLQIYLGPKVINDYAESLKKQPALLWSVRIGLLVMFVAHIGLTIRLQWRNRQARPVGYVMRKYERASLASRSMVWTGLALLAFVIYHLLHFTFGVTHPEHWQLTDAQGRHDVYSMVIRGFQDPLVSGSYIIAMLFLGMHLVHGIPSMFQTFGLNQPRWERGTQILGIAIALIVVVGNISIPLSIWLGLLS